MFYGLGEEICTITRWFQIVALVLLFSMMQLKFAFLITLEY